MQSFGRIEGFRIVSIPKKSGNIKRFVCFFEFFVFNLVMPVVRRLQGIKWEIVDNRKRLV